MITYHLKYDYVCLIQNFYIPKFQLIEVIIFQFVFLALALAQYSLMGAFNKKLQFQEQKPGGGWGSSRGVTIIGLQ